MLPPPPQPSVLSTRAGSPPPTRACPRQRRAQCSVGECQGDRETVQEKQTQKERRQQREQGLTRREVGAGRRCGAAAAGPPAARRALGWQGSIWGTRSTSLCVFKFWECFPKVFAGRAPFSCFPEPQPWCQTRPGNGLWGRAHQQLSRAAWGGLPWACTPQPTLPVRSCPVTVSLPVETQHSLLCSWGQSRRHGLSCS